MKGRTLPVTVTGDLVLYLCASVLCWYGDCDRVKQCALTVFLFSHGSPLVHDIDLLSLRWRGSSRVLEKKFMVESVPG